MSKNAFIELSESMADSAERAGRSTVMVDARKRLPASGIALSSDSVLTADHVIERDQDIRVLVDGGVEASARLAGRDPGSDLAVLKLDKSSADPAKVSNTRVRVGQFVLAIARPSKKGIESSFGTINALGGPVRTGRGGMLEQYIKSDVVSYPGFSGGPLVDGAGEVIGINTSGFRSGSAITIPAGLALKIAQALEKSGRIRRGYLGIRSQTVEIPQEARVSLKRDQTNGLLIVSIESGSPASAAALMVGDILVGISGEAVEHHDELFARLSGDVVGLSIPVEVLRGGKLLTLNVVVGER
ncbi:MAG: PDZ domain-containing protein [Chloroflexi bacterium]|nr:PDZ domain-containing protein [Chloroflexota bacterium]